MSNRKPDAYFLFSKNVALHHNTTLLKQQLANLIKNIIVGQREFPMPHVIMEKINEALRLHPPLMDIFIDDYIANEEGFVFDVDSTKPSHSHLVH